MGTKARESKAERFSRLVNARVNRATQDLRSIGNLANRASYEFTPEQAKKIVAHLRRELKSLERKFAGQNQKHQVFKL